jgi:hypothetical protein
MNEYLLELGKGGAVACVAYNPCGTEAASQMLRREVLNHVYLEGERILGKAVFAAKCSVIARYPTQDTMFGPAVLWTLLGDPALRIKRPTPTAISETPGRVPTPLALRVSPNPVAGGAIVCYSLPCSGNIDLTLLDVAGRTVRVLASGRRSAGNFRLRLDDAELAPGVYLARLRAGRQVLTSKVVIE